MPSRHLIAHSQLKHALASLSNPSMNDSDSESDSDCDDEEIDEQDRVIRTQNTKLAEKIVGVPKKRGWKCKWRLFFSLIILGSALVALVLALTLRISIVQRNVTLRNDSANRPKAVNSKPVVRSSESFSSASSFSLSSSSRSGFHVSSVSTTDAYPENRNDGSGNCSTSTAWDGGQWVCNAAYVAPPDYTPDQGWYYSNWSSTTAGGGSGYETVNGSQVAVSGIRCNETAWTDWTFVVDDAAPPICMIISSQTSEYKTTWRPTVDQFTLIQLVGSENRTEWFDCSTVVAFELAGVTSGPRARFDHGNSDNPYPASGCKLLVPFWTIVIHLDNGKVTEIEWDDECTSCTSSADGDACVDGNCGVTFDKCIEEGGTTDCSMKIYVSWTGTDSNGNALLSSRLRLSQFERFSFSSVWSAATNFGGYLPSYALPEDNSIPSRPSSA